MSATKTYPVQILLLNCGCEIEHEVWYPGDVYYVGMVYFDHGTVVARSTKEY
jgi:hypothetical protein